MSVYYFCAFCPHFFSSFFILCFFVRYIFGALLIWCVIYFTTRRFTAPVKKCMTSTLTLTSAPPVIYRHSYHVTDDLGHVTDDLHSDRHALILLPFLVLMPHSPLGSNHTRRWYNVVLMSGKRRRCWPNIKITLIQDCACWGSCKMLA